MPVREMNKQLIHVVTLDYSYVIGYNVDCAI